MVQIFPPPLPLTSSETAREKPLKPPEPGEPPRAATIKPAGFCGAASESPPLRVIFREPFCQSAFIGRPVAARIHRAPAALGKLKSFGRHRYFTGAGAQVENLCHQRGCAQRSALRGFSGLMGGPKAREQLLTLHRTPPPDRAPGAAPWGRPDAGRRWSAVPTERSPAPGPAPPRPWCPPGSAPCPGETRWP
jgi:hypothetical protein